MQVEWAVFIPRLRLDSRLRGNDGVVGECGVALRDSAWIPTFVGMTVPGERVVFLSRFRLDSRLRGNDGVVGGCGVAFRDSAWIPTFVGMTVQGGRGWCFFPRLRLDSRLRRNDEGVVGGLVGADAPRLRLPSSSRRRGSIRGFYKKRGGTRALAGSPGLLQLSKVWLI